MASENLEALIRAMEVEASTFDSCVEAQREFSRALEERDWPGLERAMARLDAKSAEVREAENARASAETFVKLELGLLGEGVNGIALRVPEPHRSLLLDLHRRLRVAAMRARIESGTIAEYSKSGKDFLSAVLEELFPEKKGRIYGKTGRAIQPGHDSILLDRAF